MDMTTDIAADIAAVLPVVAKREVNQPGDQLGNQHGKLVLKTDNQKMKELKRILLSDDGESVVRKAIEIALNDGHPSQAAMIKLCMDRTLPVSLFEKERHQRSAVTISITGIGQPAVIDQAEDIQAEDITDV